MVMGQDDGNGTGMVFFVTGIVIPIVEVVALLFLRRL